MGKPSERIYVIEADPLTGEVDRAKVLQLVSDMIGALFAVGGKCYIGADRVEVGTVMVDGRPVPLAETQGVVVRYQSFAPVRRSDAPAPSLPANEDPTPGELEAQLEADALADPRVAREPADPEDPVVPDDFEPDPERFPEDADLLSDEEIAAELAREAAEAQR